MSKHVLLLLALLPTLLACESSAPTGSCQTGATACFDQADSVLVCTDSSWNVEPCGDGKLCHDGSCKTLTCLPGSRTCSDGRALTCSADGSVWSAPVTCSAEEACELGVCKPIVCAPGALRCGDIPGSTERCNSSGTQWENTGSCDSVSACIEGVCLLRNCAPGDRACGSDMAFQCSSTGAWSITRCEGDEVCAFGDCVSCLENSHCAAGQLCSEGACVDSPPAIITESLPEATVNVSYTHQLAVEGGLAPLEFSLESGALPAGIELGSDGRLYGSPSAPGAFRFTVEVQDARGDTHSKALTLDVLSAGELRLTTTSLTTADLDYPYSFELKAAGGVPPYAWQTLQSLPGGLALTSNGRIEGTPTELGTFPITFRVLDVRTPPGYAARDLTLTVRIAPLEIIGGEQEINLFVTKVLTTPLLVPYLPYSTKLEARGGLRPYTWTVEPPPSIPLNPISRWGLPNGLTLSSDGKLSGSVTDVSDATTVNIPFVGTSLTGYFFYARVTDSQNPAEKKEAIYFIPTVAL